MTLSRNVDNNHSDNNNDHTGSWLELKEAIKSATNGILFPPNSYVETLTFNVTECGDRAFVDVI